MPLSKIIPLTDVDPVLVEEALVLGDEDHQEIGDREIAEDHFLGGARGRCHER